ncbi:MAG: NADH:ubiquinone reductase (Na(+)-transporting) subunit C [Vicingaceae bacterium]
MKMDVNSNKYTFIFSAIMVVVVAFVLALASESLKPFQESNVKREKMQNILAACGIDVERDEAESVYDKFIGASNEIMLDTKGQPITNPEKRPFEIDVLYEYKSGGQRNFPVFRCQMEDGETLYVLPMVGKGLWGPIWGYAAVGADFNTLKGATFDHKGETPGLGAEINKDDFEKQFIGKKIFNDDMEFASVKVIKGGADPSDTHGVDAISGGTITSNGVTEMLQRTFRAYEPFLKSKMNS